MVYRLPSERVKLDLDGPSVEVERIAAAPLQVAILSMLTRAIGGDKPDLSAVADVYARFIEEAQPVWDIFDHRGPVPPTASGMLRLPLALGLDIVTEWLATYGEQEKPPPSAIDALIEPGPFRTALKREMKRKAA